MQGITAAFLYGMDAGESKAAQGVEGSGVKSFENYDSIWRFLWEDYQNDKVLLEPGNSRLFSLLDVVNLMQM